MSAQPGFLRLNRTEKKSPDCFYLTKVIYKALHYAEKIPSYSYIFGKLGLYSIQQYLLRKCTTLHNNV